MNLIKVSNVIKEAFKIGFERVKVKVRDYKNRCHFISFWNRQDIDRKIVHMSNMLGDGHILISLKSE